MCRIEKAYLKVSAHLASRLKRHSSAPLVQNQQAHGLDDGFKNPVEQDRFHRAVRRKGFGCSRAAVDGPVACRMHSVNPNRLIPNRVNMPTGPKLRYSMLIHLPCSPAPSSLGAASGTMRSMNQPLGAILSLRSSTRGSQYFHTAAPRK